MANATSLGRKATIGAGWMIAWRAVSRLLGMANTIILARLLVPADFGIVAMAMAFETSLLMMTTFPVQDALLRRPETDTNLHDAAFTIQITRAILSALVIAAAAPAAARWFAEPRLIPLILALAGTTVVNGLSNIGTVQFARELRFDVQVKVQALPAVLQIIATLGVAWLTRSYWALIVGLAVSRLGRVVMTYMVHPYRPRLSLRGWRQLVGFSFWLWLTSLAAMVLAQVDTFVVGPVFGAAGLGLYTLAGQVATLPTSELVDPVAGIMFAGFSYAQREQQTTAANPMSIASALLLLLSPMALMVSAGAGSLVALLLGAKWLAAAPLVMIAACQCLFRPFIDVPRAAFIARGHVRSQFVITAIAALMRVILLAAATMTGSLMAVAAATVAASAGNMLLYTRNPLSEVKDRGGRFFTGIARIVLATLIAALPLVMLHLGWQPPETGRLWRLTAFVHLGLIGATVSAIYFVALFGLWLVFGRPNGPERVILNLLQEFAVGRWLTGLAARVTLCLSWQSAK